MDGTSALGNSLANARTTATIQRLDPQRKALILNFLHATGLLRHEDFGGASPIIPVNTSVPIRVSLAKQDFSEVILAGSSIEGANLTGINLKRADLSWSSISGSNFGDGTLMGANLENAFARGATFTRTDLTSANLRGVDFQGASFEGATLINADFSGARLVGTNFKPTQISQEPR